MEKYIKYSDLLEELNAERNRYMRLNMNGAEHVLAKFAERIDDIVGCQQDECGGGQAACDDSDECEYGWFCQNCDSSWISILPQCTPVDSRSKRCPFCGKEMELDWIRKVTEHTCTGGQDDE